MNRYKIIFSKLVFFIAFAGSMSIMSMQETIGSDILDAIEKNSNLLHEIFIAVEHDMQYDYTIDTFLKNYAVIIDYFVRVNQAILPDHVFHKTILEYFNNCVQEINYLSFDFSKQDKLKRLIKIYYLYKSFFHLLDSEMRHKDFFKKLVNPLCNSLNSLSKALSAAQKNHCEHSMMRYVIPYLEVIYQENDCAYHATIDSFKLTILSQIADVKSELLKKYYGNQFAMELANQIEARLKALFVCKKNENISRNDYEKALGAVEYCQSTLLTMSRWCKKLFACDSNQQNGLFVTVQEKIVNGFNDIKQRVIKKCCMGLDQTVLTLLHKGKNIAEGLQKSNQALNKFLDTNRTSIKNKVQAVDKYWNYLKLLHNFLPGRDLLSYISVLLNRNDSGENSAQLLKSAWSYYTRNGIPLVTFFAFIQILKLLPDSCEKYVKKYIEPAKKAESVLKKYCNTHFLCLVEHKIHANHPYLKTLFNDIIELSIDALKYHSDDFLQALILASNTIDSGLDYGLDAWKKIINQVEPVLINKDQCQKFFQAAIRACNKKTQQHGKSFVFDYINNNRYTISTTLAQDLNDIFDKEYETKKKFFSCFHRNNNKDRIGVSLLSMSNVLLNNEIFNNDCFGEVKNKKSQKIKKLFELYAMQEKKKFLYESIEAFIKRQQVPFNIKKHEIKDLKVFISYIEQIDKEIDRVAETVNEKLKQYKYAFLYAWIPLVAWRYNDLLEQKEHIRQLAKEYREKNNYWSLHFSKQQELTILSQELNILSKNKKKYNKILKKVKVARQLLHYDLNAVH